MTRQSSVQKAGAASSLTMGQQNKKSLEISVSAATTYPWLADALDPAALEIAQHARTKGTLRQLQLAKPRRSSRTKVGKQEIHCSSVSKDKEHEHIICLAGSADLASRGASLNPIKESPVQTIDEDCADMPPDPSTQLEPDNTIGSTNQLGVATVLMPGKEVDLEANTLPAALDTGNTCSDVDPIETQPYVNSLPADNLVAEPKAEGPKSFLTCKEIDEVGGSAPATYMTSCFIPENERKSTENFIIISSIIGKDTEFQAGQKPEHCPHQLNVQTCCRPDVDIPVKFEVLDRKLEVNCNELYQMESPTKMVSLTCNGVAVADTSLACAVSGHVSEEPTTLNNKEGNDQTADVDQLDTTDREITAGLVTVTGAEHMFAKILVAQQPALIAGEQEAVDDSRSIQGAIAIEKSTMLDCKIQDAMLIVPSSSGSASDPNPDNFVPTSSGGKDGESIHEIQEVNETSLSERMHLHGSTANASDASVPIFSAVVVDPCPLCEESIWPETDSMKDREANHGGKACKDYGRLNEFGVVTVLPLSHVVDFSSDTLEEDIFTVEEPECLVSADPQATTSEQPSTKEAEYQASCRSVKLDSFLHVSDYSPALPLSKNTTMPDKGKGVTDYPNLSIFHEQQSLASARQQRVEEALIEGSPTAEDTYDNETDSMGQILTKSMMQLLLPLAVPLMNAEAGKRSKRKLLEHPIVDVSERSSLTKALHSKGCPSGDPKKVAVVEEPLVVPTSTENSRARTDSCGALEATCKSSDNLGKKPNDFQSIEILKSEELRVEKKPYFLDNQCAETTLGMETCDLLQVQKTEVPFTDPTRNRCEEHIPMDKHAGAVSGLFHPKVVGPGTLCTDSELVHMMDDLSPRGRPLTECQAKQECESPSVCVLSKEGGTIKTDICSKKSLVTVIKGQEDQEQHECIVGQADPIHSEPMQLVGNDFQNGISLDGLNRNSAEKRSKSKHRIVAEIDRRRRRRISLALEAEEDVVNETERDLMPNWTPLKLFAGYEHSPNKESSVTAARGTSSQPTKDCNSPFKFEGQSYIENEKTAKMSPSRERKRCLFTESFSDDRVQDQPCNNTEKELMIEEESAFPSARAGDGLALDCIKQQLDEAEVGDEDSDEEMGWGESSALYFDIEVPSEGPDYEGLPSIVDGLGEDFTLQPVGLFDYPIHVRAIFLNVQGATIYICVCCGLDEEQKRTLFVHQLHVMGDLEATLLGALEYELLDDRIYASDSKVAAEESAIRFTPDGQDLILLDCFKLPQSRNAARTSPTRTHSTCLSGSSQPGANVSSIDDHSVHSLRIVSYREGPKVQATLRCEQKMWCLLVPGPNTMVAAGDEGCIQCWKMDSNWRAHEECIKLPKASLHGDLLGSISQLLVPPEHPHLVIGCHFGGSFAIWDLKKGTLLSTCHTPHYSFFRVRLLDTPLDLMECISDSNSLNEDSLTTLGFAAKNLFGDLKVESANELPMICLLVMASPREEDFNLYLDESDTLGFEDACATGEQVSEWKPKLPGSCRIATIREDRVVVGIPLDIKASTATTFGSYGVLGTTEGELYVWDIISGEKVIELAELEGSPITCITAHHAAAVLAVAGNKSQNKLGRGHQEKVQQFMTIAGAKFFVKGLRQLSVAILTVKGWPVISWHMKAAYMCEFSKQGFIGGFQSLGVDFIDELEYVIPSLQ